MALGIVDRVAVYVPDVDAAAADLSRLFGFEMAVFDVTGMGIRVALCEEGLELVQPVGRQLPEGAGRLVSVCLRVDDVDAMVDRLTGAGFALGYTVTTPGGLRELVFPDFHGFMLVVYSFGEEGFVRGCRGDLADGDPYVPSIDVA